MRTNNVGTRELIEVSKTTRMNFETMRTAAEAFADVPERPRPKKQWPVRSNGKPRMKSVKAREFRK